MHAGDRMGFVTMVYGRRQTKGPGIRGEQPSGFLATITGRCLELHLVAVTNAGNQMHLPALSCTNTQVLLIASTSIGLVVLIASFATPCHMRRRCTTHACIHVVWAKNPVVGGLP